jgi:hypothetical protein
MQDDEQPEEEGIEYAPAPSPEEVQAAASSRQGGWSAEQLAAWGYSWPPPKGWRAELARKYHAGEDVVPLRHVSAKQRRRQEREQAERKEQAPPPRQQPASPTGSTWTRDIGDIDPEDPPPWLGE